ncbi:MAG: hypothetical protein CVU72_06790 [Deltaproteobacteria bacterium HGW-Deltaproteobacteria-7]|nr:MAG: hypothetical protein CVU72_06790 [Deltaproteobacteria bacterium HGW-Deltaproteobacteria-7]PKN42492.1 MAG: hypothetical protein CVU60_05745 [Deltaproteobacteria bacterium HGW-Deltaproteobacteria-18]
MDDNFVKNLETDSVHSNDCHDAVSVTKIVMKWVKDFNEFLPHKNGRMLTLREFIRLFAITESQV